MKLPATYILNSLREESPAPYRDGQGGRWRFRRTLSAAGGRPYLAPKLRGTFCELRDHHIVPRRAEAGAGLYQTAAAIPLSCGKNFRRYHLLRASRFQQQR
jgi:hypothetical protein